MALPRTEELLDLSKTLAADLFSGAVYPWEVLPRIKDWLAAAARTLPAEYKEIRPGVFVHETAVVAESAYLAGPCIVCEGAEIRHCAFVRGSALVGRGAVVGNSTELKNVILFDGVQVPHYNYVGDSILGFKAHMGAGSITSNVKSDKTPVAVKDSDGSRLETGLKKFGAVLGDRAEIGCGAVLNPGTVVGRDSNVYPLVSVRGVVPPRHILKSTDEAVPKR